RTTSSWDAAAGWSRRWRASLARISRKRSARWWAPASRIPIPGPAMNLTGIHHVSMLVTDMDRSIDFYTRVLGLKEVKRPSNFTVAVRWIEIGENQIHLIPSVEADAVSPRHFALHVDDCDAARAYFNGMGIAVRETDPI